MQCTYWNRKFYFSLLFVWIKIGTDDTEQLVPVEDNGYKRGLGAVVGPFVYIIGMAGEPKLIKVGRTSQPLEDRRRALNTGNPYRLEIVAAWQVDDEVLAEKAAHKYLDNRRRKNYVRAKPEYGGGSEWFIVKNGDLQEAYKGIQKAIRKKYPSAMRVIK